MTEEEKKIDIKIRGIDSVDSDKYDRQKRIAGWDQTKVLNATAMVIGVGATGNELVKDLALTGIGKIIIVDYDIIEKSNLNRCVLFNMKTDIEGKYKVDVVRDAIKILNPEVKIIGYKKKLNEIDKDLYKQSDVICSCLDNIEARIEANNYAYYHDIPFIDSGIDEYFGSLQTVYSEVKDAPCLQCGISDKDLELMWKKFSCTGQEIQSENGETTRKIATIITTTSIIAGLQSQQVLKFILGIDYFRDIGKWDLQIGEPLIGKQLNYNGLTNKFNTIKKFKDPQCWRCSYKKSKA